MITMETNNNDKIEAVKAWQNNTSIHPLTCGKDSKHKGLIPVEKDGEVILKCPDCGYIQKCIPDAVLQYSQKNSESRIRVIRKPFP
jgi:hypothetical protein